MVIVTCEGSLLSVLLSLQVHITGKITGMQRAGDATDKN